MLLVLLTKSLHMIADNRGMQPPAQERLVPRHGLAALAQLLLELDHLHVHQVGSCTRGLTDAKI